MEFVPYIQFGLRNIFPNVQFPKMKTFFFLTFFNIFRYFLVNVSKAYSSPINQDEKNNEHVV